jgi:hypothetical protein
MIADMVSPESPTAQAALACLEGKKFEDIDSRGKKVKPIICSVLQWMIEWEDKPVIWVKTKTAWMMLWKPNHEYGRMWKLLQELNTV